MNEIETELRNLVDFVHGLTPSHQVGGSLRGTQHHEAAMTGLQKAAALLVKYYSEGTLSIELEKFLGEARTAQALGGIGTSDLDTITDFVVTLQNLQNK